ncbi:hypothetical protein CPAST_c04130 [Clostridium pasteurianum DSM 525 = ATCC 6013]|uniref:Uncharacterized protein n=1 Tax=Clostridium pasteurianum DSM 525 = ATCC 6013 TaxID=1262449 RepID=A0A0H3J3M5_CLOPA|nr:hypothetical protein [Clostridium pasteurianum]AJA46513.1 hypothetical protein CPAST_c04130 [Clostridium pasteurianum DSM 525 = ATCC 6013]AJA50501.1 hypothetical protein CLPA_c04130 [Clostridium pasteurianum DSM 525 = ATCC 6013]AOZ73939.1 hypothetical protein AQ983_02000 [Clostridium pasteurianum DSM 525 = ATCC 6013]AOZ77736.1 hypothetical protein AQ984_02000 [Clostridium pasteurianum]ELP61086.1 hypothetical protein F502_01485 [Clostridium pasteurianum DSM 525 = ATCC 6013]
MSLFDSLTPKELNILVNIVAVALTEGNSADDNNVLGNFLTAVSANILVIAAQQQTLSSLEDKQKQIKDLKKQIKKLENDL